MTLSDINSVFSSIQEIHVLNQAFLTDLKRVVETWTENSAVGNLFQKHVHFQLFNFKFQFQYTFLINFKFNFLINSFKIVKLIQILFKIIQMLMQFFAKMKKNPLLSEIL